MPSFTGLLTPPYGEAAVEVEVAVPYARTPPLTPGGAVPAPWTGLALLDTGAGVSVADPAVIRALNLPRAGWRTVLTPSSGPNPPPSPTYRVDLTILHHGGNSLNHYRRSRLTVVEAPVGHGGYDFLIGTDVLSRIRFIYDGTHNPPGFTLAY